MNKNRNVQGRKYAQVSEGAKDVFMRDGYAGASVDDIAQAGRVSKATLYSYFPDKALMFREAIRTEVEQLAGAIPFDDDADAPPQRALPHMCRQIAQWLIAPTSLRLHRIHVAEAGRFPDLSDIYQTALREGLYDRVRLRLERWVATGELRVDDTALAARQLVRLAGAGLREPAILGRRPHPSEAEVARIADSAARVFLAAHAVPPAD